MRKIKIIRSSTIPMSLNLLLRGQLSFLNKFFEVVAVSSSGTDLDIVRDREGVSTQAVEMERGISPLKDLISLIRLFLLFRREKPALVHSITPKAGLLSMLAAKLAGVPVRMHTFTGLIFPSKTGVLQQILIMMDRLLCWAATHIYPEGQGVKNDLIKYKITSKPLKIVANGNVNGVDVRHFSSEVINEADKIQLKSDLGIHPEDFIYVFVGRLVGDKGINELVEAFHDLNINNSKLLLVGPYEDQLDPLSVTTRQSIEQNKNIITVGFQSDVRPYLAIADILVFPSYREGFPNVVLQAAAMGIPAIVTNISGSNEIIVDNENGLVVEAKDAQALKNAMKFIHENPDLLNNFKLKSRNTVLEKYEQSIVWGALLDEYNALLK